MPFSGSTQTETFNLLQKQGSRIFQSILSAVLLRQQLGIGIGSQDLFSFRRNMFETTDKMTGEFISFLSRVPTKSMFYD